MALFNNFFAVCFIGLLDLPYCSLWQYANGGDLQAVIKKAKIAKTPIPEKNIWKYLIQTCKGLQYLHDHKILHRFARTLCMQLQ